MGEGGGSGPGDHPGVSVIELLGDSTDAGAIEAMLETGRTFLFQYTVPSGTFAVFASKY